MNFDLKEDFGDYAPFVQAGKEWLLTNEVEFVKIEQDSEERTILTFLHQGKQYKSLVVNRFIE